MAEEAERLNEEQEPAPAEAAKQPAEPPADPLARIAELEAELAKAKDEHLRALAEVDNTRRRGERQAQEAKDYAIDRFTRDLLPVADTMSRALSSVAPEVRAADEHVRALLEGVEMTERAMIEAFTRHGLKRVGEKGEKFDPNQHQAVAQVPSDAPAGAVAEVLQAGYVLNGRTIRAAMVAVSTGQPANQGGDSNGEPGAAIDIKV